MIPRFWRGASMADIFFSYSSLDRERVRPIYQALSEQGFDIFWDQSVPAGTDWDRWIRQHLNDAKCAIVFWSVNSVASDNVRHEATVAKQRGKLVPVLLDPLTAEQFPMGSYSTQGANLSAWAGEIEDVEWTKVQRELEARLTPLWLRRIIDRLEAELVAERARRDAADRRDRALRDQIVKEVQAQEELRRELQQSHEEIAALKARPPAAAPATSVHDRAASARQDARTTIAGHTDTPADVHDRPTTTRLIEHDRMKPPMAASLRIRNVRSTQRHACDWVFADIADKHADDCGDPRCTDGRAAPGRAVVRRRHGAAAAGRGPRRSRLLCALRTPRAGSRRPAAGNSRHVAGDLDGYLAPSRTNPRIGSRNGDEGAKIGVR